MKTYGWLGKKVRHADGRTGEITQETLGAGMIGERLTLTITVDGGRPAATVIRNRVGPDGGEGHWQYQSLGELGVLRWYDLTDHAKLSEQLKVLEP